MSLRQPWCYSIGVKDQIEGEDYGPSVCFETQVHERVCPGMRGRFGVRIQSRNRLADILRKRDRTPSIETFVNSVISSYSS